MIFPMAIFDFLFGFADDYAWPGQDVLSRRVRCVIPRNRRSSGKEVEEILSRIKI